MPKHLQLADAADYARGLVEGDRKAAMETHLVGCRACTALVGWQAEVASLARREADYTPPADVVRLARAIFPPRSIESPWAALPRLLARLVADTASQPLPVGVRGSRTVARHALFEAGGYSVDLRLEEDEATSRVVLVGQVLAPAGSRPAIPRPEAVIVQRKRVVAQAPVNEFGEFRLDCVPARGLTLQVPVDGGERRMDVPLGNLMPVRRTDDGQPI